MTTCASPASGEWGRGNGAVQPSPAVMLSLILSGQFPPSGIAQVRLSLRGQYAPFLRGLPRWPNAGERHKIEFGSNSVGMRERSTPYTAFLVAALLATGCAVPGSYNPLAAAAKGRYKHLELSCNIEGPGATTQEALTPLSANGSNGAAGSLVQQASYQHADDGHGNVASTKRATKRELVVVYPHPNGDKDTAVIAVRETYPLEEAAAQVGNNDSGKPPKDAPKAWIHQISKQELDAWLTRLNAGQQSADNADRTRIQSQLRINAHSWRNRLDNTKVIAELVAEVQRSGKSTTPEQVERLRPPDAATASANRFKRALEAQYASTHHLPAIDSPRPLIEDAQTPVGAQSPVESDLDASVQLANQPRKMK